MKTPAAILLAATAAAGNTCTYEGVDFVLEFELVRDELPPLPEPVSNNAVVAVTADGREYLISFNGIGPGLTHDDTHDRTFVYDGYEWREADPVPGEVGRLASVAVAV